MLKVRDLMSQVIYTAAVDDTVESVAEGLARAGVSGAPVRDDAGAVVGVVSLADLTNVRRRATVADVMTPDVMGVYADDPAVAAALEMANHDIHRVVVWNADGVIAGIVTSLDLVRAIARGADFAVESSELDAQPRRKPLPPGFPRSSTGPAVHARRG